MIVGPKPFTRLKHEQTLGSPQSLPKPSPRLGRWDELAGVMGPVRVGQDIADKNSPGRGALSSEMLRLRSNSDAPKGSADELRRLLDALRSLGKEAESAGGSRKSRVVAQKIDRANTLTKQWLRSNDVACRTGELGLELLPDGNSTLGAFARRVHDEAGARVVFSAEKSFQSPQTLASFRSSDRVIFISTEAILRLRTTRSERHELIHALGHALNASSEDIVLSGRIRAKSGNEIEADGYSEHISVDEITTYCDEFLQDIESSMLSLSPLLETIGGPKKALKIVEALDARLGSSAAWETTMAVSRHLRDWDYQLRQRVEFKGAFVSEKLGEYCVRCESTESGEAVPWQIWLKAIAPAKVEVSLSHPGQSDLDFVIEDEALASRLAESLESLDTSALESSMPTFLSTLKKALGRKVMRAGAVMTGLQNTLGDGFRFLASRLKEGSFAERDCAVQELSRRLQSFREVLVPRRENNALSRLLSEAPWPE